MYVCMYVCIRICMKGLGINWSPNTLKILHERNSFMQDLECSLHCLCRSRFERRWNLHGSSLQQVRAGGIEGARSRRPSIELVAPTGQIICTIHEMVNGNSAPGCTCDSIDTFTDGPFIAFTTRRHLVLSAANCTSSGHEYGGVSINRPH